MSKLLVVSTDFIEKNNARNDNRIFRCNIWDFWRSNQRLDSYKSYVLNRINQHYSVSDSWKSSFKKLLDFRDYYISSSPDFTKWEPYSLALEVERVYPAFHLMPHSSLLFLPKNNSSPTYIVTMLTRKRFQEMESLCQKVAN